MQMVKVWLTSRSKHIILSLNAATVSNAFISLRDGRI
jgi:hypothetical protein